MILFRSCCGLDERANVGLNWNVYSEKLTNRMNSIENTLHSSTGHTQIKTDGREGSEEEVLKAFLEQMLRIRHLEVDGILSISLIRAG